MQTNNSSKSKRNFYDPEKLKAIPITQVCEHFGIRVDYKTREPRCSIRTNDKHPSTILHTEATGRFKANTYHDFGTNESGDVISLTCKLLGLDRSNKMDRYEAMQYLGEAFQISPENRSRQNPGELSDREYRLIGLQADRATKNFRFNPDLQSIDRIGQISRKYSMSLNELKQQHPRTYEHLLKMISFPRLTEERNIYYMSVWDTRRFLRAVMGEQATLTDTKELDQKADELRAMEHALTRAVLGTQLSAPLPGEYAPQMVLDKIDSGTLKPRFGSKSYQQMKHLADRNNTALKCRTLQLNPVLYRGEELFQGIPYSAFFYNGNAVVHYLERDADALKPVFQAHAIAKPSLEQALDKARQKLPSIQPVKQNASTIHR